MVKILTKEQAEILLELSDKYLKTEDTAKDSVEVITVTQLAVVFWHYAPESDGNEITLPWFEFVIGVLAPKMFSSQLFKFNGIVSKCIMAPINKREDLMLSFKKFDSWIEKKQARKQEDTKNKLKEKDKRKQEKQLEDGIGVKDL